MGSQIRICEARQQNVAGRGIIKIDLRLAAARKVPCAELSFPLRYRLRGQYRIPNGFAVIRIIIRQSVKDRGVSRIQGVPLPWPGPVFERLLRAWDERVGVSIRGQILAE